MEEVGSFCTDKEFPRLPRIGIAAAVAFDQYLSVNCISVGFLSNFSDNFLCKFIWLCFINVNLFFFKFFSSSYDSLGCR